ncbi:hypothetical protein AB0D12_03800 [Streptomyces sp. NPDC048479]|uniref:hypothetical protein n=1 Tax=Streptomyces sp. NPDC048479 TaxID=3154725 RepID=UPI00342DECF2
MPIDPFAALNAMLRAEAARSTEPEEHGRSAKAEPDDPEAPFDAGRPSTDADGAV